MAKKPKSKKPKRLAKLKTAGKVAAVAGAIGIGVLSVSFNGGKPIDVPAYHVVEVIDGDTFKTKEIQFIRDNTYNAPELDECGGPEAKKELEKLILNKEVYAKVTHHTNGRLMASVYNSDGLVGTQMLASGWVELSDRSNLDLPELKAATDKAQLDKIGLFSEKCTPTVNLGNPACLIKGNYNDSRETKLYYFPGCNNYPHTTIQLHHGDQWFCTEAEAKKAGFIKSKDCPEKYESGIISQ